MPNRNKNKNNDKDKDKNKEEKGELFEVGMRSGMKDAKKKSK